MATVITKSIGMLANGTIGPGRDYKNLTELEAALPASLVAVDQQWTAQLYNDGIIQETGATTQFGSITDATRFVRLEAAPGQSFMDHDFSTDPLRLDPAYGVTVKRTSGVNFSSIIEPLAACDYMQIKGLQLWTTDSKGRTARLKSSSHNSIEDCILLANNAVARETCDFTNSSPARNCLIIAGGADALSIGVKGRGSSSFINCSIVRPSDLATGSKAIDQGNGSNAIFENCAVFGFGVASNKATLGDFNATDDSVVANLSGASTKRGLVFTSQFVNTTLAGQDWKVKDAAADIADGGASTNGFVTGFDILGRARDVTLANRSIGAYEFIAGGGTTPIAQSTNIPWNLLQQMFQTVDTKWDLLQQISQTVDAKWKVRQEASRSSNIPWDLLQQISQTVDAKWKVRQEASRSSNISWNILSQILNASQSLNLQWDLLQQISQTVDTEWDLLQQASQTVDTKWDLLQQIAKTVDTKWDVRQETSQTVDTEWDLLQQASQTVDTEWDLLQQASQTVDTKWDLLQQASQTVDTEWDLLQQASQSFNIPWNIISRIQNQMQIQWDVLALIITQLLTNGIVIGGKQRYGINLSASQSNGLIITKTQR